MSPDVAVTTFRCPGDGTRRPTPFPPAERIELCLVRRGAFRFRGSRGSVVVDPTVALFTPPADYEVDHPGTGGDLDTFVVLSPALVLAVAGGDLGLPVAVTTSPAVDLLHRRLLSATTPDQSEELATMLFVTLLAAGEPARVAAGAPRTTRAASAAVAQARMALAADPDLSLRELSRLVGCAPHHLSRCFRRLTGQGVAAQRIALRCARALDELAAGGAPAEVAARCGFSDHAHLARTLRRRFDLTPTQLRILIASTDVQANREAQHRH